MKNFLGLVIFSFLITSSFALAQPALVIVFPTPNHQTSTEKIFFLGTAPPDGEVFINGARINRSRAGHFSPSLPLRPGKNIFQIRHQNQEVEIQVTRLTNEQENPKGSANALSFLTPAVDIARLPGELICFSAIAPPNSNVTVKLADQTVILAPQPQQAQLPANSGVLTGLIQPKNQPVVTKYQGCTTFTTASDLGKPLFELTQNGQTLSYPGDGKIQILSPAQITVHEVTSDSGVTRTGPSTDYSRLTPLPQRTQVTVTGREGEWLRLDYGAWINSKETRILPGAVSPRTIIRGVGYRPRPGVTEILFPLQVPVPVSVQQGDRTFALTLYNTTAQTDIIRLDDNPLISRLDWQQIAPGQLQYTFKLKKSQQWGYKLRYENTTLILAMRHEPTLQHKRRKPLAGIKIVIDPGHGGKEPGASGPNRYLEKDANLAVSKMLRDELVQRGATVVMTRVDDRDVSLVERQAIISQQEPAIAVSIHHNSLPDDGDAENTKGFGSFWYHPPAHDLAVFMHNYVVKNLSRPSYGVYWNNLALTRPAIAPTVLLELGFMSNPEEFEQVINPTEQRKMAKTLAKGITEWLIKGIG